MTERESALRTLVLIVWGLYLASIVILPLVLIGVVIAYLKRGDAAGTVFQSHFNRQISTFWWTLLAVIIGALTSIILIGFVFLALGFLFYLWRSVVGTIHAISWDPYGE